MTSALEADLPRELTAARAARALLVERFGQQLDREALDAAKLLVTELVNNAVLHGRGSISLRAELDERRLHVDVVDEGSGFAHEVAEGGFDHLGGRGLQLVAAQASSWGVHEGTTHVWFELESRRA